MRAIYAGENVAFDAVRQYLYCCTRKQGEIEYYLPVKAISDCQIYVELNGLPLALQINLINLCNNTYQQIIPEKYIIGKDANGSWYGVFTFNDTLPAPQTFAFSFSFSYTETDDVYFSQAYRVEPCDVLQKLSACFPVKRTDEFGFDANGIWFGTTTDPGNSLGDVSLSYQHEIFTRRSKVFKLSPKVEFTSNAWRNFRTNVTWPYEFRCESVPDWMKGYFLSIYARGFVKVDEKQYQVTDINFTSLNENDLVWLPYGKLQEVMNYQFGCDDCTPAPVCCEPTVINVSQSIVNTAPPAVNATITMFSYNGRQQCGQQGEAKLKFDIAQPYSKDIVLQVAYVYGFEDYNINHLDGAGGSILPDGNSDKPAASSLTPNAATITIPANTKSFTTDFLNFPYGASNEYRWGLISYPTCNPTYGRYYARVYFKIISPVADNIQLTFAVAVAPSKNDVHKVEYFQIPS